VSDAAGNPYVCSASSVYQPRQYPLTYYRSGTGEPLKIGAWFQHTANATFAPEEVGTTRELPLQLGLYSHIPGTGVQIGSISAEVRSIGEFQTEGKHTDLTVNVDGGDAHTGLLVQVLNERGEFAHGVGPNDTATWIAGMINPPDPFRDSSIQPGAHRSYAFMMDLPPDSSKITVRIAVNQGQYFEFTPTPTVMPAPKSP
jgi:hypothetical protein